MELLQTMVLASLLAWASGIRLYLVVCAVGLLGHFEYLELPAGLKVLEHPWVIGSAASCWRWSSWWTRSRGSIRSGTPCTPSSAFPRARCSRRAPPAIRSRAMTVVAGLLGGTITAGTHFTKAGSRAVINTSPEPVSNWGASFTEDALAMGGIWLALTHPLVFLGGLASSSC
jgi:hypothetical protein